MAESLPQLGEASLRHSSNSCLAGLLLTIASCYVLSACTALPGGSRTYPIDSLPPGSELAGIVQSEDQEIFVLYVHGMGQTSPDFQDNLVLRGVENIIGAQVVDDTDFGDQKCHFGGSNCRIVLLPEPYFVRGEALPCENNSSPREVCKFGSFGELQKTSIKTKRRLINVYSYFWDGSADRLQEYYVYTDLDLDKDSKAFRPLANATLKKELVTYGFSDAALYLGPFGLVMRRGLEGAICLMISDALDLDREAGTACQLADLTTVQRDRVLDLRLAFAAKSLGSRYLFDTLLPADQLDELTKQDSDPLEARDEESIRDVILAKQAIAATMRNVYLMANQLPLLGLGRVIVGSEGEITMRDKIYCDEIAPLDGDCRFSPMGRPSGSDDGPLNDHGLFTFAADSRKRLGLERRPISVVAFHDPADLLGYKAGAHFTASAKGDAAFVEVINRNAFQWLWLFALPSSAHAKEDEHRHASQIIWCGAGIKKSGRLQVRECGS